MGLRSKLGLIFLLVSSLAILVLCVAVYTQAQSARLDRTRSFADERVQLAADTYERTGVANTLGSRLDDPALPPQLKQAVLEGKRATYKTASPNARMWAAQPVRGSHIISVVQDYEHSDPSMDALRQALIVGGIGTVAMVALVSVVAAGSLSRRIVAVAGTARRIANGELDASAVSAVGAGKDEVASLARALDTMAGSLRAQLEAERRFTADVAHDLRTPVTGLLTAAELLPPGRPSELVRDRAKVLRRLVEDLLEIARFDSGVERVDLEHVWLGAFVESAVGRLRMQQELAPDSIVVRKVGPDVTVSTDPRRIERILANLIVNGLRHGRPPVEVTVDGRTIEVVDHGSGYPDALIAEGPRRFRSGLAERGIGHGLGLTIAVGHAKVLGADLVFGTAPDGGACSRLVLPPTPEG
ncbi:MAG TPA: HAMP domain-containing sensor histidine kinase [Kribbella sp.]|nr:HAMP domain-containing sensor histidine kinase [Kribbella sp.]